MKDLEWMDDPELTGGYDRALEKPFDVHTATGAWRCVSEGHFLLAVARDENVAPLERAGLPQPPPVVSLIDYPTDSPLWAGPLHALLGFVGEIPAPAVCDICQGSGWKLCAECHGARSYEHRCDCGDRHIVECECGDGTEPCGHGSGVAPRYVLVFDACFDANLIALVLGRLAANYPSSNVELSISADVYKLHIWEGSEWRFVLMGLSPDPALRKIARVFPADEVTAIA